MRRLLSGFKLAGSLLLAAALLVPLTSALTAEIVPLYQKAIPLLVLGMVLWRPAVGLLATAAFAPLGGLLAPPTAGPPARLAEAVALAFLSGWLISRVVKRGKGPVEDVSRPALLFALAVLTSAIVGLGALWSATSDSWPLVMRAGAFVGHTYLLPSDDFPDIKATALLLEGVGLMVATVIVCSEERDQSSGLLIMTVAIGLGLAGLNVAALVLDVLNARLGALVLLRVTEQVPDFNAAGSYLVMILPLAVALTWRQPKRYLPLAAGTLVLVAIWLTGSRAAIAVAILVSAAAALWRMPRERFAPLRRPLVALTAALLIVGFTLLVASQLVVREISASRALDVRRDFLVTSLRMIGTHPLFGIGIGRYYQSSGSYMPPRLRQIYSMENAHNNFLQVAAELGIVGLALFLWPLGTALRRNWKAIQARPNEGMPGALFAGLIGFLVTALVGHPLLVPEVAYPFWIMLGVAAGIGRPRAAETSRSMSPPRVSLLAALIIVGSAPFRITSGAHALDLSSVTYGLDLPERSLAGTEFRRIRDTATFFVPRTARAVELPLSIANGSPDASLEVELSLDGHLADRVRVSGSWTNVRMFIPRAEHGPSFHQLSVRPACEREGARCRGSGTLAAGDLKVP
jgi:O-Antigen ligase